MVLKTDTIYGILAKADAPEAVEKLYAAKHRDHTKSCILLVSDVNDIPGLTGDNRDTYLRLSTERPLTIVTRVTDDFLPHLPRQQGTLAFRLVRPSSLATLISLTGPLLAPSANTEGRPPATTIQEAVEYFGDSVAVYVDGGQATNTLQSKIIAINDDDEIEIIRD